MATSRGAIAAALWLLFSVIVTLPALSWHVAQFGKPGPVFLAAIGAVLVALSATCFVFHRLRRTRTLWPALVAATCALLGFAVVYQPKGTAFAVALALCSWALGSECLTRIGIDSRGACAAVALAALTGLGVLTFLLFATAAASGLYPSVCFVLLAAPLLLLPRHWRRLLDALRAIRHAWESDQDLHRPAVSIAVVFVLALAGLTAVVAVVPSNVGDAVAAHLPLARVHSETHSLAAPPTILYGWFPQAFEVLAAMGWSLAGQPAAQTISILFFALAALQVAALARECGYSRAVAVITIGVLVSLPFLHWTGTVVKNDMAMAAWELAALYAVLRWRTDRRLAWLLLSAFFVGLAFQVKHVALFGAVPVAILWVVALRATKHRLRNAIAVAAAALVFSSFSAVRTWVGKANPVYPESLTRSFQPFGKRRPLERLVRWIKLPYYLHFEGKRYFESSSISPVGVVLLCLVPLVPFARRRAATDDEKWKARACAVFAGAYLLYWSIIIPMPRYSIPAMMVGAVFLAAAVERASENSSMAVRGVTIGVWTYALVFGCVVAAMIESYPAELGWLARRTDDAGYLRASVESFGALDYLKHNAGRNDEAISIGGCASVYSHNPAKLSMVCAGEDHSPEALRRRMEQNPALRWVVLPNGPGDERLFAALRETRDAKYVYGDAYFSVYRLRDNLPSK